MTKPLSLRCSALPLHFKCPGSARPAAVPINASNDAADVGTAGHDGLAGLVRTGKIDWDGTAELASKHAVDETELRVLLAQGHKLWAQVHESFPNARAEVELKAQVGSVALIGHLDVLGVSRDIARIGDWKLGRLDSDYREQLLGYSALALLTHHTLTRAEAGVMWVREGEYEPHTMDREGLMHWMIRVEQEIVQWDGVYHPGSHCQYCPRSHECSAANALARRDLAVLMDEDLPGHLENIETVRELVRTQPDKAIEVLELARRAEKQAGRVIAALKDEVLRDGPILGGTKRAELQRSEKRHLNVLQAFPVLQGEAGFGDEELAEVISISLSKAETLVAKRAGKGQGAKAVRELGDQLAKAGAIETSASVSLVVRRQA